MNAEFEKKISELRREVQLLPNHEKFGEFVFPKQFCDWKDRVESFEVRDDDIWVTSFLKSGTTWVQEMVWLLVNNLDYDSAKRRVLIERYEYIEVKGIISHKLAQFIVPDPITRLDEDPGRRFIKSHLPWQLLPLQIRNGAKKPKIIYITRNVKDVVVSLYHFTRLFDIDMFELDHFFKLFITDNYIYSPYWKGVLSYWNNRHLPNLLLVKYEDMITDLPSVIREVASFLETPVPDGEMGNLLRHLSFAEMKKNRSVNYEYVVEVLKPDDEEKRTSFMRKGKVGSYKDDLSEEMVDLLEVWAETNVAGTGFPI